MATGITGQEQHGNDAITAAKPHCDPFPLPLEGTEVRLDYSGKVSTSVLLEPVATGYAEIRAGQEAILNASIGPNAFVLSDNFFALHKLISEGKKVDLVYLDPPFGTGLDFHSRQLEHAYKDDLCPAAYLEFIRRRLILIREVMNNDASIYLHIGHQMVSHLKALMDEVFGAKNFKNLIARRKCSSKNFTRNQYANLNDYVLFYTKSSEYKWNQPGTKPDDEWIEKEYPKVDARGRYKLVPVHAPGTRRGETGMSWRGMSPPPGKHWQYQPSKLEDFDAAGEIHWSKNGNPRRKVYLEENKLIALTDYWDGFRDAHHQSIPITGYPTEKNFGMLKMIVAASSNEGDIVLDPFCGSGTALHAAKELGRKWIGIDQSFIAAKATITRLRHGLRPMGDYVGKKAETKHGHEFDLFENPEVSSFGFYADDWLLNGYLDELIDLAMI